MQARYVGRYRHNCDICGQFVPVRNVSTCGGGFTGEPLELVEARCDKHTSFAVPAGAMQTG